MSQMSPPSLGILTYSSQHLHVSTDFWSRFDVYTFILLDFHVTSEQVPLNWHWHWQKHTIGLFAKQVTFQQNLLLPPFVQFDRLLKAKQEEPKQIDQKRALMSCVVNNLDNPIEILKVKLYLTEIRVSTSPAGFFCSFYFYLVSLFIHDIGL